MKVRIIQMKPDPIFRRRMRNAEIIGGNYELPFETTTTIINGVEHIRIKETMVWPLKDFIYEKVN